jgi:opacity protein-like surface antigen
MCNPAPGALPTRCKRTARLVRALFCAAGAASFTNAYPQTGAATPDGWQFELTPYLWAAGLKGATQVGALPRTSVDVGFDDILDNLDFAAMGSFEARKGRWGLLFDAMYIKLSASGEATRTGSGPIGATLTATADLDVEQTLLTAAVAYRFTSGPTEIDALGGLRYTKVAVDGDIGASLFGLAGTVTRSGDKDWVDPIVGVRARHRVADRWWINGYADVGGFGVGSDLTWQAIAGVEYEISKTWSAKGGYRVLKVDYDRGGTVYDMKTSGIYLGLGIRF